MQPHNTTPKLHAPRCSTCKKAMRLDGTCPNCAKPEVAEYYRLDAQGLRRCNICQDVRPLADFALIRKGQARRRTVCTPCSNAKNKAYRDAHAERLKARQDERKTGKHEWYEQWRDANYHAIKVRKANASARRRNLPAAFTVGDWERVAAFFEGRCAYCNQQEGDAPNSRLSADHFVPFSSPDCPGSIVTNILPACLSCNLNKRAQNAHAWLIATFGRDHAERALARIESYFAQHGA